MNVSSDAACSSGVPPAPTAREKALFQTLAGESQFDPRSHFGTTTAAA